MVDSLLTELLGKLSDRYMCPLKLLVCFCIVFLAYYVNLVLFYYVIFFDLYF